MEVRINKDVREFHENILLGLSLRQTLFSIVGCLSACGNFLIFNEKIGSEITSWLCILGSLPFIIIGFFKFQGLNFEKFICCFFKSIILKNRKLTLRETLKIRRRLRKNVKNN